MIYDWIDEHRALAIEIIVVVFLAGFLDAAGVPVPWNITIALWPVILFNLAASCWNLLR